MPACLKTGNSSIFSFSGMKKLLRKLLVFCLLPFPVLFLLQYMIDTGLRRSHHPQFEVWNDVFAGRINADLLVLGSSRAWVQISPAILDSALGMDTYNLGMDGTGFQLQYEYLKAYLKHNRKPRYILHEVGFASTLAPPSALPNVVPLLPYLSDEDGWSLVCGSQYHFNIFDRYFPCYKYNNQFSAVQEGMMSYFGHGAQSAKFKGYQGRMPVKGEATGIHGKSKPGSWKPMIDSQVLREFRGYMDFCRDNDIQLILVNPPMFYKIYGIMDSERTTRIFDVYHQLSAAYGVPFLNYHADSMERHSRYYYNFVHLNRIGAELFSRKLAADLIKGPCRVK